MTEAVNPDTHVFGMGYRYLGATTSPVDLVYPDLFTASWP